MKRLSRAWRRLRDRYAMYHLSGAWNRFFDLWTGGLRRPVFFDVGATLPQLRALDAAFPAIREELLALLPYQALLPRYHEIDTDLIRASGRYDRDKSWNVFMLYSYGARPAAK